MKNTLTMLAKIHLTTIQKYSKTTFKTASLTWKMFAYGLIPWMGHSALQKEGSRTSQLWSVFHSNKKLELELLESLIKKFQLRAPASLILVWFSVILLTVLQSKSIKIFPKYKFYLFLKISQTKLSLVKTFLIRRHKFSKTSLRQLSKLMPWEINS